ncbi:MAG: hypothetical protein V9H69_03595 [Anaerolineae bacterium]
MDEEAGVRTGLIGLPGQLVLQAQQVVLQPVLEGRDVGLAALALAGAAVGEEQVGPGVDLVVHGLCLCRAERVDLVRNL